MYGISENINISIIHLPSRIIWGGKNRCTRNGKQTKNDGKSPCFMGKFTINGDFPSFFVCLPGRVIGPFPHKPHVKNGKTLHESNTAIGKSTVHWGFSHYNAVF